MQRFGSRARGFAVPALLCALWGPVVGAEDPLLPPQTLSAIPSCPLRGGGGPRGHKGPTERRKPSERCWNVRLHRDGGGAGGGKCSFVRAPPIPAPLGRADGGGGGRRRPHSPTRCAEGGAALLHCAALCCTHCGLTGLSRGRAEGGCGLSPSVLGGGGQKGGQGGERRRLQVLLVTHRLCFLCFGCFSRCVALSSERPLFLSAMGGGRGGAAPYPQF